MQNQLPKLKVWGLLFSRSGRTNLPMQAHQTPNERNKTAASMWTNKYTQWIHIFSTFIYVFQKLYVLLLTNVYMHFFLIREEGSLYLSYGVEGSTLEMQKENIHECMSVNYYNTYTLWLCHIVHKVETMCRSVDIVVHK